MFNFFAESGLCIKNSNAGWEKEHLQKMSFQITSIPMRAPPAVGGRGHYQHRDIKSSHSRVLFRLGASARSFSEIESSLMDDGKFGALNEVLLGRSAKMQLEAEVAAKKSAEATKDLAIAQLINVTKVAAYRGGLLYPVGAISKEYTMASALQ